MHWVLFQENAYVNLLQCRIESSAIGRFHIIKTWPIIFRVPCSSKRVPTLKCISPESSNTPRSKHSLIAYVLMCCISSGNATFKCQIVCSVDEIAMCFLICNRYNTRLYSMKSKNGICAVLVPSDQTKCCTVGRRGKWAKDPCSVAEGQRLLSSCCSFLMFILIPG